MPADQAAVVLIKLALSLVIAGVAVCFMIWMIRKFLPRDTSLLDIVNPVKMVNNTADDLRKLRAGGERVGRIISGALDEAEIHYAGVECQNCGATSPASATYCPQCGHQPDGTRRHVGLSVRVLTECRGCHASVAAEAGYCPNCGRPM